MIYPTIDSNKNDGYLSLSSFPDLTDMKVQSGPSFPKMLTELNSNKNDGYPSFSYLNNLVDMKVQVSPFPRMMVQLNNNKNDGYPSFSGLNNLTDMKVQVRPFPKMMPSVEEEFNDGYPTFRHIEPGFGAFSNVETLEKITIPQTVKYIADYVFYNTSLAKAKIARDCVFFEHTFPPDCVISYYE